MRSKEILRCLDARINVVRVKVADRYLPQYFLWGIHLKDLCIDDAFPHVWGAVKL